LVNFETLSTYLKSIVTNKKRNLFVDDLFADKIEIFPSLALQLHFMMRVSADSVCLMSSSKDGPTENMVNGQPALCEFHGKAADFLDRPADDVFGILCVVFFRR